MVNGIDSTHKADTWILVITAIILLVIISITIFMFYKKEGIFKPYDWNSTKMECPNGGSGCYTRLSGKVTQLSEKDLCLKNAYYTGQDPKKC